MLSRLDEARRLGLPSNLPINGHSFRRVEVLTGAERRRHWSTAEKAAIVAETLVPGPEFVPIVAQGRVAAGSAAIEIEIGDMVVRASPGIDLGFLVEVIRVLKATA